MNYSHYDNIIFVSNKLHSSAFKSNMKPYHAVVQINSFTSQVPEGLR